ncbi:MAG: NUDIX domain-containing protein [Roseovarius sp.]
MTMDRSDFEGAKLILLLGGLLAVLRRDDVHGLPFRGMLDLPGGMREPGETPETCALRETREELGLEVAPDRLVWRRLYTAPRRAWFFAAHLPRHNARHIRLGEEGQGWMLMRPQAFITSREAVPHFRPRVRHYLAARQGARLDMSI